MRKKKFRLIVKNHTFQIVNGTIDTIENLQNVQNVKDLLDDVFPDSKKYINHFRKTNHNEGIFTIKGFIERCLHKKLINQDEYLELLRIKHLQIRSQTMLQTNADATNNSTTATAPTSAVVNSQTAANATASTSAVFNTPQKDSRVIRKQGEEATFCFHQTTPIENLRDFISDAGEHHVTKADVERQITNIKRRNVKGMKQIAKTSQITKDIIPELLFLSTKPELDEFLSFPEYDDETIRLCQPYLPFDMKGKIHFELPKHTTVSDVESKLFMLDFENITQQQQQAQINWEKNRLNRDNIKVGEIKSKRIEINQKSRQYFDVKRVQNGNFYFADVTIAKDKFQNTYNLLFPDNKIDNISDYVFKLDARDVKWSDKESIFGLSIIADALSEQHEPICVGIMAQKEEDLKKNAQQLSIVKENLDKLRNQKENGQNICCCFDMGAYEQFGLTNFDHPCPVCHAHQISVGVDPHPEFNIRFTENTDIFHEFEKYPELVRNEEEEAFLGFKRKDCKLCMLHGPHRIIKMVLRRLYSPALEKLIKNRIPDFKYLKEADGGMEPTNIDAHQSMQTLFRLCNWVEKAVPNQKSGILEDYNSDQKKKILDFVIKLKQFLKYLSIKKKEEKYLKKLGLWNTYIDMMDDLGLKVYKGFISWTHLNFGFSWYFHTLTLHCKFLLQRDGALGKYSNQSFEQLHAKHRKMYENSIQRGDNETSKYHDIQDKIFSKTLRILYQLQYYGDLIQKEKWNLNNKEIRREWGIFIELLFKLGYQTDTYEKNQEIEDMQTFFFTKKLNIA